MQTSLVLQEGASCSWLPSASQTGPTLQLPLCLPQWSSTFKGKARACRLPSRASLMVQQAVARPVEHSYPPSSS